MEIFKKEQAMDKAVDLLKNIFSDITFLSSIGILAGTLQIITIRK